MLRSLPAAASGLPSGVAKRLGAEHVVAGSAVVHHAVAGDCQSGSSEALEPDVDGGVPLVGHEVGLARASPIHASHTGRAFGREPVVIHWVEPLEARVESCEPRWIAELPRPTEGLGQDREPEGERPGGVGFRPESDRKFGEHPVRPQGLPPEAGDVGRPCGDVDGECVSHSRHRLICWYGYSKAAHGGIRKDTAYRKTLTKPCARLPGDLSRSEKKPPARPGLHPGRQGAGH